MDIAQEMLKTLHDDSSLLKKVITGDESWVYGPDIEKKPIILMEASRRAETDKSTSSSVKCEGFAHCSFRLQWREKMITAWTKSQLFS